MSFVLVLHRTRRPLFLCFLNNKKYIKIIIYIENKNEKRIKQEKEELQCLHAFTGFTAWTSASGRLGGKLARMKLFSLSLLPSCFQ